MSVGFFTLIGSLIEIVGVFFLSVEAIKLPNLRRFRDQLLLPLSHALRFEVNPDSFFGKEVGDTIRWTPEELAEFRTGFRTFVRFHLSAGWLVTSVGLLLAIAFSHTARAFLLGLVSTHHTLMLSVVSAFLLFTVISLYALEWLGGRMPPPILLLAFSLMTLLNPLLLIGMLVGEGVHLSTVWFLKGALWGLHSIDARTPDGTIGILGFLLVLFGTLIELFHAWS